MPAPRDLQERFYDQSHALRNELAPPGRDPEAPVIEGSERGEARRSVGRPVSTDNFSQEELAHIERLRMRGQHGLALRVAKHLTEHKSLKSAVGIALRGHMSGESDDT
jgi:hypothetical protein